MPGQPPPLSAESTAPPGGLPSLPNFPTLPTTYYPPRLPPSFYSHPTASLPSRAVPSLLVPLSYSPELPRCPSERSSPFFFSICPPATLSQRENTSPPNRASPRPEFPPFPTSTIRPGCLPLFTSDQPSPSQGAVPSLPVPFSYSSKLPRCPSERPSPLIPSFYMSTRYPLPSLWSDGEKEKSPPSQQAELFVPELQALPPPPLHTPSPKRDRPKNRKKELSRRWDSSFWVFLGPF